MKNKFLIFFSIGLMTLGTVIGGSAALYFLVFKKDDQEIIKYEYNSLNLFDNVNKENNVIIKEAYEEGKAPWLDNNTLKQLRIKIRDHLDYGPEIFKLREIIIGDKNNIKNTSAGVYYPSLNKMYINYDSFEEKIRKYEYKYGLLDEGIKDKIKIDLIFETIFHEYGHHIASTYLNNEFDNTKKATDIYLHGKQENWNKYFIDKFKEYLNYKDWNKRKYSNELYYTNNSILYKSIGSVYSQQDLFKHANQKNEYDYRELDNKSYKFLFTNIGNRVFPVHVFIPVEEVIHKWFNRPNNSAIPSIKLLPELDKKQLRYMYSMDELFTRKYQQLNEVYTPTTNKDPIAVAGFYTNEHGALIATSDLLINTSYYQTTLGNVISQNNRYELIKNSNKTSASISDRFLYDAPFRNNEYYNKPNHVKDLYNLMDGFMGHLNDSDVSILWSKNTTNVTSANSGSFTVTDLNKLDYKNYFKFGGFINNNQYKSIGYLTKNTNGNDDYHKLSDIFIHKYQFKHKEWLGASKVNDLLKDKDNYFYTTLKWINKNDLINKKLVFEKNDGTIEALKSIRKSDETGTVSSYQSHLHSIMGEKNIYSFISDSNGVEFKKIKEL